jgi:hypothetical protein
MLSEKFSLKTCLSATGYVRMTTELFYFKTIEYQNVKMCTSKIMYLLVSIYPSVCLLNGRPMIYCHILLKFTLSFEFSNTLHQVCKIFLSRA